MPKRIDNTQITNPFQKAAIECSATWLQLEAAIKSMEACTIRGELQDAEVFRAQAESLLSMHLDAKQASIMLVHHSGVK